MIANYCAGTDYDVSAQRCGHGQGSGGMDGVDEFDSGGVGLAGEGSAGAVVADGDDNAGDVEFGMNAFEVADAAVDGQSIDASALDGGVVIEESDGGMCAVLLQYVEDDTAMAAGADDEDAFARAWGVSRSVHSATAWPVPRRTT